MPRFRRYRIIVYSAVITLFLLYHLSRSSQWEPSSPTIYRGYEPPVEKSQPGSSGVSDSSDGRLSGIAFAGTSTEAPSYEEAGPDGGHSKTTAVAVAPAEPQSSLEANSAGIRPSSPPSPAAPEAADESLVLTKAEVAEVAEVAQVAEVPTPAKSDGDSEGPIHRVNPPGALQEVTFAAGAPTAPSKANPKPKPTPAALHWQKMPEHFPVPEESLIQLPTGAPKSIPRIQYDFGPEAETALQTREARLSAVRDEMLRAWHGYRTYAWTHDELMPLTKTFRDPFCGWAASLVDSLDTLWIMGLRDDFDDAYEAVKNIDFTTTPYRSEIPVFETIIRYLGGLIAAYDISGGSNGTYPVLLDKAVELAEVLMSVFDTPNRMPVLYYRWKPLFASQPRMADTAAGIAELGSMTMEFTRLAQLTGQDKYYDAIARIVNALEEWQSREAGTAVPGIFPERVDASGCNRSAAALEQLQIDGAGKVAQAQAANANDLDVEPFGYQPPRPNPDAESTTVSTPSDLELRVDPTEQLGDRDTGDLLEVDEGSPEKLANDGGDSNLRKRAGDAVEPVQAYAAAPVGIDGSAMTYPTATISVATASVSVAILPPKQPLNKHNPTSPAKANGDVFDWKCTPQNLTAISYGSQSYSMGGSQDSTYEYFPKQYLLLGGLVPKYQVMHEKVIEAVKKYLLYRPMIEDETRDILFSARVSSRDGTDKNLSYTYEVTHLTCFLGGMFAMGGRIFNHPEDVEIGAKLADGCAWAYEAMPVGIMPEFSTIQPCADMADCPWNKTLWHDRIDPSKEWRAAEMVKYEQRLEEWKAEKAIVEAWERRALEAAAEEAASQASPATEYSATGALSEADATEAQPGDAVAPSASPTSVVGKRGLDVEAASSSVIDAGIGFKAGEDASEQQANTLKSDLDVSDKAGVSLVPGAAKTAPSAAAETATQQRQQMQQQQPPKLRPEPKRPQTHEEFVEDQIKRKNLQPGFIDVIDRKYILRPEAIESVWYMYRITGDPTWQEKGWRMFTAVIKATQTEAGHSAIRDVTVEDEVEQSNNMESFWFSETLKYFYLLFSPPDVVSLDDWVLNTEAHPFRRPT